VVDDGDLLGIISENDIRGAFVGPKKRGVRSVGDRNPARMKVGDYMTENPLTVFPETHIEDAALLIYKNKIGALPVIKLNKLVGIISIMDILGIFIDIMGIIHSSSRIDVIMGKDPAQFDKVSKIIHGQNLNIISVSMAPYKKDGDKRVYSFRLDLCDTKRVADEIGRAGFKVVAAIE
jgi:acetoin utilization protein AcuB